MVRECLLRSAPPRCCKTFQAACTYLWGHHYRVPAARELGCHLRTLMRYDAGKRAVPAPMMAQLGALLVKRQVAIAKLLLKVQPIGEKEAA